MKKWVCARDNKHIFDEPTEDYFCPICPPYEGILMEVDMEEDPAPETMHPEHKMLRDAGNEQRNMPGSEGGAFADYTGT